ncbi:DUF4226 domain-containing protein [Mycobacterium intracellulare]|uniref:DUF4226 domain-containing protein n=1 Tax=Mycobacterium intracellulare TaxID=1767 RepID=UPI001E284EA5|nr:DUF4226 domain-containing protein [Mycobacterium intracellulare]UGT99243.1 DUF4226 domain-containing protein [Mycobacterium intracellulare]
MGLFDVLDDLFDDLTGIFGGDDDGEGGDEFDGPPQQALPAPPAGAPPWGPALPVPNGPSGLQQGVDHAGTTYQQASGALTQTDDKLAGLLKQIFATNDDTRSKIGAIIGSIETARRALTSDPQMANDPHAMALFNEFLDGQLAQIQQLLDSSKVDNKKQAELLAALGDEYRDSASGGHSKDHGNAGIAGGGDGGGADTSGDGGGSGGGDGGAGGITTGAGPGGLTDPLAGLSGLGGAGLGDPLSMLGPAMAGLGSIPGALGGAAGSLPMDALGAMGPLASGLAGQGGGDGFKDSDGHDHGKSGDFEDGSHGKGDGDGGKNGAASAGKDGTGDKNAPTQPAGTTQPQPSTQPAPPAAVPASAGGDPSRVVQMPDGSAVTASTAQHAAAVRAVLNGATVSDGWKQAHVELPPPGTPVTAPADPSHLVPGQIAQFKSRDPVMYMGNGKIWLDGQLQPQSALPTGDFLGWVDPPQLAGTTTPALPPPSTAAPAGQPTTTNISGS